MVSIEKPCSFSLAYRMRQLFGPMALGWGLCWLIPGWLLGNITALLDGSAPHFWKVVYIVSLYLVIIAVVARAWKKCGPLRPRLWPLPVLELLGGLGLGLAAMGLLCLGLSWLGLCSWPAISASKVVGAIMVALLLAWVEEWLFRGYLLGVCLEHMPNWKAYLTVSGLFSVVHLLGRGSLEFKLAYAVGLVLLSLVLCRLAARSGAIAASVGFHAGVVTLSVLPGSVTLASGLVSGLNGQAAAGLAGWAMLALVYAAIGKYVTPRD